MSRFIILLTILGVFNFSCQKKHHLVLNNANILDVTTGKIKKGNIAIDNGKISAVATAKSFKGETKIDLAGKYIVPGLWDMHVHVHGKKSKLEDFYGNGVLGIRDMGVFQPNHIDSLMAWSHSSKRVRISYVGHLHNDTTCFNKHKHVGTLEDVNNTVNTLKSIGSNQYKVHNCFPMGLLPSLSTKTKQENVKIVGHIPEGIDPLDYCREHNVGTIEHIGILTRALSFRNGNPLSLIDALQLMDGPYLDTLALTMKENNIAFTPNLIAEKNFIDSYPEEQKALGNALFNKYLEHTKRISDHGVRILVGTDTGLTGIEPGISLHKELKLMSQAGLSNLQLIQAATTNASEYLSNKASLIQEGFPADFLIIGGNPLEDLQNLGSIFAIVTHGDYEQLDHLD